jgi:hypothetical protein
MSQNKTKIYYFGTLLIRKLQSDPSWSDIRKDAAHGPGMWLLGRTPYCQWSRNATNGLGLPVPLVQECYNSARRTGAFRDFHRHYMQPKTSSWKSSVGTPHKPICGPFKAQLGVHTSLLKRPFLALCWTPSRIQADQSKNGLFWPITDNTPTQRTK